MKRILCIALATLLSISSVVSAMAADVTAAPTTAETQTITFKDVDASTVQGQAIYKLVKAGVILGDGDGTFRPNDGITRGELCKIVNLIFGYTEKADQMFSDVTDKDWYKDFVLVAQKAGYIKGHDDGTFRGEDNVTREEACTIITRVATLYDLGITVEIKDAVSDWAMPYVQKVVSNYLMPLEAGNLFRATENITRGEFCEVFSKFLKEQTTDEPKQDDAKKDDDKKDDTKKDDNKGNTGGSTGGSTGGNTGGNTGGSTGGNTGGSTGGNTKPGDPDPSEPDPDEPDSDQPTNYEEINAEMVKNLQAMLDDLNRVTFGNRKQRQIIDIVKQCISDTIAVADSEVIDSDYVRTTYSAEIGEAKTIYNENMDADEQSDFKYKLGTELNSATTSWLMDAFDIQM